MGGGGKGKVPFLTGKVKKTYHLEVRLKLIFGPCRTCKYCHKTFLITAWAMQLHPYARTITAFLATNQRKWIFEWRERESCRLRSRPLSCSCSRRWRSCWPRRGRAWNIRSFLAFNPFTPVVALMQHQSAFFKIAIKPKPSIIYTQTFFEYVPYMLK